MHELAVTQSILEIAVRHAEAAGAKKVTGINLVIGEFASIVDSSVQFYWEILAGDSIAREAILHFERIPGEMTCTNCQLAFHPEDGAFTCPDCHSGFVTITRGDEFRVDSIDVE